MTISFNHFFQLYRFCFCFFWKEPTKGQMRHLTRSKRFSFQMLLPSSLQIVSVSNVIVCISFENIHIIHFLLYQ
jgi:hypothetical protein